MGQNFLNLSLVACHNPSLSPSRGEVCQLRAVPSLVPLQHLASSSYPNLNSPTPLSALTLFFIGCLLPSSHLISPNRHKTACRPPTGCDEDLGGKKAEILSHLSSIECSDRPAASQDIFIRLLVAATQSHLVFSRRRIAISGISLRAGDL